ncbi:hypothetical protein [Bacillus sp. ISL-4]|nr:hypothetical protein [Bacillus sp. ISL-4]
MKRKNRNVDELPGVSVIADYHAADTIQEMTTFVEEEFIHE